MGPIDADWWSLVRIWGPLALGWPLAYLLVRFIMDNYKADIESRVKLSAALEGLTKAVERNHE